MTFEVIIIGASTAGLHAATKPAAAGKKVAVFDRQKGLNSARRTWIVTPEIKRVRIMKSLASTIGMTPWKRVALWKSARFNQKW